MFPVESLRPEGTQYTHFEAGVKRGGEILGGGEKRATPIEAFYTQ